MHPLHLSIRIDPANEDHHLWDNNGTWWCHYTLHRGERRRRCRVSLGTRDRAEARARRDHLFDALRRIGEDRAVEGEVGVPRREGRAA